MLVDRNKILATWQLLNALSAKKTNVKFHFFVLRNKKLLEDEVKMIDETINKFKESREERERPFHEERIELCKTMSQLDEVGNPKLDNNSFVILEGKEKELELKVNKLRQEKYSHLDEELLKEQKAFEELIEEEVDINFVLIPESEIPESLELSGQESELLFDLIKF